MRLLIRTLLGLTLPLLVSCATATPSPSPAKASTAALANQIAGVHIDMSRDDVREALASSATFEREERRRQEIWTLRNDAHFSSLLIGYTPEWTVRYVTAIAKPEGEPVHYRSILDPERAEHRAQGDAHTYTWTAGSPAHAVIASGAADKVQYLSLKKLPRAGSGKEREGEEDEEDDD